MQQFTAWGNAPGIAPTHAMRAVGAKAVQAERHELTRMAEAQPVFYKSSRRRYRSRLARNLGNSRLHNGSIGTIP